MSFKPSDNQLLQNNLDQLVTKICRKKELAFDFRTTTQQAQRDIFWRIVRRTVPTLFKLRGDRRALPFIEDMAIAPDKLPAFLRDVHRILNSYEVTASVFAYVPQGHIHLRPFMSLSHQSDLTTMQKLANELFEKVLEYKGTISGCHGNGLSRTWFLRRQFGSAYNVLSQIKELFDPDNILNPGKIVGHPHSGLTDHVRKVEVADSLRLAERIVDESKAAELEEPSDLDAGPESGGNADQGIIDRRCLDPRRPFRS